MYIILVYDIVLDETGPAVLRKVFKECKKYLVHVQNSVFEGEISEAQLFKLEMTLKKFLRKDRDSLIVFKSRHEKWLQKEFWGKEDNSTSNFI